MTELGNCFEVAGQLVIHNEDLWLCHGLVTATGPPAGEGTVYWHAWVERMNSEWWWMNTVIDRANGHDFEGLALAYYHAGSIDESQVRKYSPDEARVETLRYLHWGPWDEDHPPKERNDL